MGYSTWRSGSSLDVNIFLSFYSYFFAHSIIYYRLRLLGRTPPSLEYPLEEEHAEKGAEEGEQDEKVEPKSAVESLDRSSKGVYYKWQFSE